LILYLKIVVYIFTPENQKETNPKSSIVLLIMFKRLLIGGKLSIWKVYLKGH